MPMTQPLKRLSALLLAASLALPVAAQPSTDGDKVSLNFANAEIEAVIKAIGKITGGNFLIDPRVKGNLNIVTNTPVAKALTYDILLSALRLQGYTAVESSGVTKIVPEADAKLHAVPVGSGSRHNRGAGIVTQVFTLQNESAAQMVPVIRPLISPNNTVSAYPSNNALVVTDYADNVERIARIIASVDVPQGDLQVIELKHAAAADIAGTLSKLLTGGTRLSAPGAAADPGNDVSIVPDARTNALLVRASSPSRLSAVRQLVASLDRPGAGGNIHVVYLKNAEATRVADTLRAVLSGDTSSSMVESSRPLSASENKGGLSVGSATSSSSSASTGTPAATSGGGIIQADPLSNALIITAPEAIYNNLRHVIEQLDRRRAQVYVEALIAEITAERAAEWGIQWQSANTPTGSGKTTVFGGTNFGSKTGGSNILGISADPTSVGGGLNFLVGSGTLTLPNGTEILNLSVLARFLETDAKTNILSTPNLVTLDNEEAKIVIGRNLPFITGQYTNTGGGTTPANPFQTIERQDVGLTLKVKPQITEGGVVRLQIYQEASTVVGSIDNAGPITNKRSIESTVLIDDGAIIALGGLVEDSYESGEEKVPLLGDIPLAGNLFRYDSRKRSKTNLVVFLRPVILRSKESYSGITNSRYDYVIGQQRGVVGDDTLLRKERSPAELPPIDSPAPAVPRTRDLTPHRDERSTPPAPVEERGTVLP